ncbi:activator-dependent family glycosyltransferase [Streptomyces sp. ActVer]|uniref:activator-dependent family glycosyltransferase n=1 Tax=Streptomyces sp. ActVer TaxID=3014558 RepID=UPI0022B5C905|nr:activator-dependent family glycosyltransferase [Streptomyces sp. ActVer]MCZ4507263.1 activator-dependent family glycosyltransferase [Streptomyces sp. ActVer]
MRVLLTIFPATSHLYSIVPLAWALQSAGHEVVVASHSGVVDPGVIGNIGAAGLTAVSLGTPDELSPALGAHTGDAKPDRPSLGFDPNEPEESGGWRTARSILASMFSLYYPAPERQGGRRPVLDNLVDFARAWRPDLVLWDPLMLAAPIAARVSGAAHARLVWGMDNVAVIHDRTKRELADPRSELTEHPWLSWFGPMLERYGLELDDEMLLGQWTLDLTQSRMRHPLDLTHIPVRRVPYTGAAALPDWMHARPERPRAVLTLGVSRRKIFGKYSGFPMREFFESVSALDVEVVATLNNEQLAAVGKVPDNVRTVEYVPLNQVLPTSSAIIHHGGGGTFAAAVPHRVPQLVVPLVMWDEMVTARYVADMGAGLVADPAALDVDGLHKQLVRLLEDPSFQLGARGLYEEMLAAPAPTDVVPLLERLTAERR